MESSVDEEALHQLYLWVDNIPLSRPKRNLSRDFSDGVLVAELIKFYFPKMVEMHNYVPANSLQQKLSNWGHLNRKVLNKLNFSVPDDVMRKIAQCSPGVVELVLIPLRQRLEERQRRQKLGVGSLQELVPQDSSGYMDMGLSQKVRGDAPTLGEQLREGHPLAPRPPGYNQALQGDPNFVLQIAEKEQELLASQETVQVLQMKVKRLEHLLQLKNVRIDDLSRRLQQAERKQRKKDHFPQPRKPVRTHLMTSQIVSSLKLPALGLERRSSGSFHTPRTGSFLSIEDSFISVHAKSPCPPTREKLSPEAEEFSCPFWVLTWDPSQGWKSQQLARKG
ncbi:sperm flagellar protein 1 isoform X1 [Rattus norvegicus]|nr:sperm flagellar protein 1 isoform X1 [Rattus norvegicus]|eukprot:XP_006235095.1 PREDICTED: sperm flagellar protein 1 isoform X1 [Rattus norvegicus]